MSAYILEEIKNKMLLCKLILFCHNISTITVSYKFSTWNLAFKLKSQTATGIGGEIEKDQRKKIAESFLAKSAPVYIM